MNFPVFSNIYISGILLSMEKFLLEARPIYRFTVYLDGHSPNYYNVHLQLKIFFIKFQ